jgi:hypothetical protein
MRSNLTRHARISRLAALALLGLCFVQPHARAQAEVSFVFHTIPWGMVRGQTARFSVFNPNEPSEPERGMVFIQVVLFDASGAVIATSDEIAISPGEFRSVDFNHDDLTVAGEPGTGRVQTHAQVRYRSFFLVDRTRAIGLPTSLELIDNSTGRSNVFAVWLTIG